MRGTTFYFLLGGTRHTEYCVTMVAELAAGLWIAPWLTGKPRLEAAEIMGGDGIVPGDTGTNETSRRGCMIAQSRPLAR